MPIKHNLKLIKNMIRFSQFDTYQVFDILKYRASLGFKPGVFTDGHIRMVADNAIKRCEGVTYGIKVLHWAGKLAQENHRSFIRYDDIRRAIIFTGAMWIG
jgi:Cdc6-like AAA superfamily ATPase